MISDLDATYSRCSTAAVQGIFPRHGRPVYESSTPNRSCFSESCVGVTFLFLDGFIVKGVAEQLLMDSIFYSIFIKCSEPAKTA